MTATIDLFGSHRHRHGALRAVDLFAGAGGFSTGAAMAGINVVWAANHWQEAVEIHATNHPDTLHVCQDLHQADWSKVPEHDILMASPCCQGHSRARGTDSPQHDASRSTAWAVVSAAEYHRPKFAVIENVPEFMDWPLFPAWRAAMKALGYHLTPHIIDAADHGVAQNRVRLYLVASRDQAVELEIQQRAPKAAAEILDLEAGSWSVIRKPGRSPNTLERVANGRRSFGQRFVMPYYGSGSGKTGRCLSRPLGTVTTRDRWALVDGEQMRMLTATEYRRAMGFPRNYALPRSKSLAVHLLGNAVVPAVARDLLEAIQRAA